MSNVAAQRDLPAVRDFPDRLPPMVVKELRQGLRAKLFGESIAGFHLVLIVILLPAVSFGGTSEITGIQRLLWWIFIGVLVLLLPLRGLSALIQERRENTLDTLLLTNLSAGRIVWGKWLAIASQILVTGVSLIPYAIMMYAAGGISLTESLMTLLRLGLLAVGLTAAYVALSWNGSWLWRAGPAMILTWLALTQYAGPMVHRLTAASSSFPECSAVRLLAEIVSAASLIYLLLEAASARLAPWTEDHRTGPRLVGWALPLLLAVGVSVESWRDVLSATCFVGLTAVSLTALTEPWPGPPHSVPPAMAGVKRRSGGLPAGWPHGVAWAMAAWGLLLWVTWLWLPDRMDYVLRLIAWLFAGRLLLFLYPKAKRSRAPALLSTALVFFLLETVLFLSGDLLDLPALSMIASSVPGVFPMPALSNVARNMSGIAAATAGSCALLALLAWLKHRPDTKEATQ